MVSKKSAAEGWPQIVGDYAVGDAESAVAVVTLGSHMENMPVEAGAGISGSLHTENLGIEKVIGNVISNPNIRFLVVCGAEVQGHITGQTIKALHENGVDQKKRIVGAKGAIPYLENVGEDAIERFRNQIEMIDLVDTEDYETIHSKIDGCLIHDPGAYEEETAVISLPKQKDPNPSAENT